MTRAHTACPTCDRGEVPSREEIERIARELIMAEGGSENAEGEERRAGRLRACAGCDELAFDVVCRQCGCFVQIRSLNPKNRCPHPAGNRWE